MGSLMAGWHCKSATLKRTRSLTKDEIDAYWKSKKKIEEEHLTAISSSPKTVQNEQANKNTETERKFQKSISMPVSGVRDYLKMDLVGTGLEHLIKKNGWWTKSSWAFLNEPPVNEAASFKYTSQFHVANLGSPKFNPQNGISA